jgi:hypothetical protein
MSCVLRIAGDSLDVDALLAAITLTPFRYWRKHDPKGRTDTLHTDSGAVITVSGAEMHEVRLQVNDATHFLEQHLTDVRTVATFTGVDFAALDFGVSAGEGNVALFCYFPPKLVQLAASAGIGLETSFYAFGDDFPGEQTA